MASNVRLLDRFLVNVRFDHSAFEYHATVSSGSYLVTLHAPTQPKLKDRVERLIRGYFGAASADIVFRETDVSDTGSAWAV
jgi:hypothetical protein